MILLLTIIHHRLMSEINSARKRRRPSSSALISLCRMFSFFNIQNTLEYLHRCDCEVVRSHQTENECRQLLSVCSNKRLSWIFRYIALLCCDLFSFTLRVFRLESSRCCPRLTCCVYLLSTQNSKLLLTSESFAVNVNGEKVVFRSSSTQSIIIVCAIIIKYHRFVSSSCSFFASW